MMRFSVTPLSRWPFAGLVDDESTQRLPGFAAKGQHSVKYDQGGVYYDPGSIFYDQGGFRPGLSGCCGGCDAGGECEGLGKICTASDCSLGESAVKQMRAVFDTLGRPSKWYVTVTSIEIALKDAMPWFRGFSSGCCTVEEIGKQAAAATASMLRESQGGASEPLPVPQQPKPKPEGAAGVLAEYMPMIIGGAILALMVPAITRTISGGE